MDCFWISEVLAEKYKGRVFEAEGLGPIRDSEFDVHNWKITFFPNTQQTTPI